MQTLNAKRDHMEEELLIRGDFLFTIVWQHPLGIKSIVVFDVDLLAFKIVQEVIQIYLRAVVQNI